MLNLYCLHLRCIRSDLIFVNTIFNNLVGIDPAAAFQHRQTTSVVARSPHTLHTLTKLICRSTHLEQHIFATMIDVWNFLTVLLVPFLLTGSRKNYNIMTVTFSKMCCIIQFSLKLLPLMYFIFL